MLIRKLFKAEMAHMVPGAYTRRCHYLHGHSYKFELFLESDKLNPAGMVADFQAIKDMGFNDFFDSFDHAVMLWNKSPLARLSGKLNPRRHLVVPFNPTAEMIAKSCFLVGQAIIKTCRPLSGEEKVEVERVIVHETETGYAVFRSADLKKDKFPPVSFHKWEISDGIKADWKGETWYKKVCQFFQKKSL